MLIVILTEEYLHLRTPLKKVSYAKLCPAVKFQILQFWRVLSPSFIAITPWLTRRGNKYWGPDQRIK